MGRQRRLKQERREQQSAQTQEPSALKDVKGQGLNVRLDRRLTLFAFVVLLLVLVLLTPILTRKQSHELQSLSERVFSQLEAQDMQALRLLFTSGFQKKYSPSGLSSWLEKKGLSKVQRVEKVWEQIGKTQAIVRGRFEMAGKPGILTASFLSVPSLSLDNRWQLAQLCRADLPIQSLVSKFLVLLQAQDYSGAYALTADGVIRQSIYTPGAFAKHIKALALPRAEPWEWQPLQSLGERLILPGTLSGKQYHFELLEKPDTCDYLILELKEVPSSEAKNSDLLSGVDD